MALPSPPPVPLFPSTPSYGFTQDDKLYRGVQKAIDELKTARNGVAPVFRLAIVDLGSGAPLKWGGYNADTMDYIASEAKVAALYAAFVLRDMVRRYAGSKTLGAVVATISAKLGGTPPPKAPSLFDGLRTEMNPAILANAHPLLAHTKESERLPNYEQMFVAPPGGIPDFTGAYKNSMRAMIVPSSNTGAMECIHGIGYAYLNGVMTQAMLFKDGVGPWLAGDFIGQYTYARIDTTNDQGAAQAGTAFTMAKLMSFIMLHAVTLGADAYAQMETLLHDAVTGPDTPFLTRNPPDFTSNDLRIPRDKITHIKLGLGPLKSKNGGQSVGSEVWRLKGLMKPDQTYVVAYQNLDWTKTSSEDLAFVIRRSIELYEN